MMMNNRNGGSRSRGQSVDLSDDESTPLSTTEYARSQRLVTDTKEWDVFGNPPPKTHSGSMPNKKYLEVMLKIMKSLVYLVVFLIVLGGAVVAKGTILLMTSQLRPNRTLPYCNKLLGKEKTFVVTLPEEERIAWIWCIVAAFAFPELCTLIRSIRMCLFKSWEKPSIMHFMLILVMETFHVVGLALMFVSILPDLDVVQGVMLMNCMCFVPGLLGLLSRNKKREQSWRFLFVVVDIIALAAQATAFVAWPLLHYSNPTLWVIPIALIFISCGWWENYVSVQSPFYLIRSLGRVKEATNLSRYFTYMFMSVWKIIVFTFSSFLIIHSKGTPFTLLFTKFRNAFSDHSIKITEVQFTVGGGTIPDLSAVLPSGKTMTFTTDFMTPIYVLLIQIFGAYLAYVFGKFACKILIQGFSYALPVTLTIPVSISLLIVVCGLRNEDPCFAHGTIPNYVFFQSPPFYSLGDFLSKQYAWVWLMWLLSQVWITIHIWSPKCERLATTENLFVTPMYDGLLVDQSMGLNRKRDDQPKETEQGKDKRNDGNIFSPSPEGLSSIKNSDRVTKIYACGTMWHENKEEIKAFLKSILRLDEDQCARKNVQHFLQVEDPDYYELETHIFFDDAFELCDHDETESQVNPFVKQLVDTLDEAAFDIHQSHMHIRAPKKYPTPYGGRLVWTLPGNTKMIAHLKDKSKIRHRKRWSQVMYMYYLLGHRLMQLPISIERKEVIAANTYLLALDGDIDFQPSAVKLLVDLMKKNKNLGAACGRIHPIGSGPMVWYQIFEYAIGHWLQKATEHVIGCVLCSPGCFSLFRGGALMDYRVMNKYTTRSTEAKHYVQYDQGEDRWLCTLLLQRGYGVEYSAASDAYTHAPEGFNEFYNQRRRWVPSTMANIMDLIMDYKNTIKNNNNISIAYMSYQVLLMVGTILGPGTIFLMLVGACVAAFQISNWTSFGYNFVPVAIFMIVCFMCKSDTQLIVAAVISILYGLVMMAVLVGILIQIAEDGWVAPSSLFLFLVTAQLVVAGLMHPQEVLCLVYGIIYYVTIPSMYMLLVIYSLTNLNDVTWGTREVAVKKTIAELEEEDRKAKETKETETKQKSFFGRQNNSVTNDDQGSIEFSFAGLFKCMLCTHGKNSDEKQQLANIASALEHIKKRLDVMEKSADSHGHALVRKNSASMATRFPEPMNIIEDQGDEDQQDTDTESIPADERLGTNRGRSFLVSPYWLEDEDLKKGEVDFLSPQEEQFWEEIIEKYLFPIDEDKDEKKRIAKDLKDLRDKCVFAFFMLNALFVLILFLMQLNQEELHIEWPIGVKTNISYDRRGLVVHITQEHLQLEPIGLMFVCSFALILVIQFTAMMCHRLGTLSHILAGTSLGLYCCKKPEDVSGETLLSEDAIAIVKDLQRSDSLEIEDFEEGPDINPSQRHTVRNLERGKRKPVTTSTLDAVFRQRFFSIAEGSAFPSHMSARKSTKAFKAFEARRSTVIAERRKSQMQTMGAKNLYGTDDFSLNWGLQQRPPRASQMQEDEIFTGNAGVMNIGYDPDENEFKL